MPGRQGVKKPATTDSIAQARASFPQIRKYLDEHPGESISRACARFGVPTAAYEFVQNERSDDPTKSGTTIPEPPHDTASTPSSTTASAPSGGTAAAGGTSGSSGGGAQGATVGQAQSSGSTQAAGPSQSSGGYMAAAARVSGPPQSITPTLGPFMEVNPASAQDRVGGQATVPSLEGNLVRILRGLGGLEEKDINGICWAFLTFYDAEDFEKLSLILRRSNMTKGRQEQVMEAWRNLLKPSDLKAGEGSPENVLDSMMRRRGLAPDNDEEDLKGAAVADLQREEQELKVLKLRRDMNREKKEMEAEMAPSPSATDPSSDTTPVVLNINGQPVAMTIPKSQLHMYAKWLPGPNDAPGQTVPVGPPPKSPEQIALEEENKRLKEDAERKRLAEEAEARDKRFMEAMREMVKSIVPQQPAVNTEAERLKAELERERENRRIEADRRRDEDLAKEREHRRVMEARLQEMQQPGYWVRQRQDEVDRGRALGMIPREEATRITEEDIQLKAKQKQVDNLAAVQTRVGTVLVDKAEGKGPVGQFFTKLASSPSVQAKAEALLEGGEPAVPAGGNAVAPPDAALIEAAKRAGAMGPDVPTPAGVN